MELTNEQWEVVAPLIPPQRRRRDGKGRPRVPSRAVLDGILWVLWSGAPWKALPSNYPPYQTCHRRMQEWVRERVFKKILRALAEDLGLKAGQLFGAIRVAVTGRAVAPPLFETLAALGRERSLARIAAAAQALT